MIQAGVGLSTHKDTHNAALEATQTALSQAGINTADFALVFATADHGAEYTKLLRTVQTTAQATQVVGCSAGGVLISGKEVEQSAGIAVLTVKADSFAANRFFIPQLRGRGQETGKQIAAQIRPQLGAENLLMVFPDTYNFNSASFFNGFVGDGGLNIDVVGGGASEDGSIGETFQLCGDTVSNNAVSGALLSGDFCYSIGISQACQPIGPVHTVTKADRNLILELDNRPAFEVFSALLPPPLREDLRRTAAVVFAGMPVDAERQHIAPSEYVVRNLVGFDADQGIVAIADEVHEGQKIVFTLRSADGSRADLKRVLEKQAETWTDHKPAFGLYINCVGRGRGLYGFSDLDTSYIAQYLGDVPIIGFFSGCEIAPIQQVESLLQYTGVLVLIGERPAMLH
jgi:small ligand-binding sensory domain FIST